MSSGTPVGIDVLTGANAPSDDDAPPAEGLEAAIDEQEEEEERDLLSGLRELAGGGEIKWEIWRVSIEPGRGGYVATLSTSQLSVAYIGQRLGGGKYKIRGKYPNGQFAGQRTIEISEDVIRDPKYAPGAPVVVAPQGPSQTLEYVKIIGPIVAPIIAAMMGNRGPDIAGLIAALKPPPAPTMPEMMTALASLKALAPEQTTTPLDNALKLLEVIQEKGGMTQGETNWLDIVKTVVTAAGPSLGSAIEKMAAGQLSASSATRAPRLAAPAPASTIPPLFASSAAENTADTATPSPQPETFPADADAGDHPMLRHLPWLKNQLVFLTVKAARNSDPGLYADLLIDNLPDGFTPSQITELLSREDWWKWITQLCQEAAPYEGWFTQLRNEVLEELKPEPSESKSE